MNKNNHPESPISRHEAKGSQEQQPQTPEEALKAIRASRYAAIEAVTGTDLENPARNVMEKHGKTLSDLGVLLGKMQAGEANVWGDFPDSNRIVITEDGSLAPIERVAPSVTEPNYHLRPLATWMNRKSESRDPYEGLSYEGMSPDDLLSAAERQVNAANKAAEDVMADMTEKDRLSWKTRVQEEVAGVEKGIAEMSIPLTERDQASIDSLLALAHQASEGNLADYKGSLYEKPDGTVVSRNKLVEELNATAVEKWSPEELTESILSEVGYKNLGVVSSKLPESFLSVLRHKLSGVVRNAHTKAA